MIEKDIPKIMETRDENSKQKLSPLKQQRNLQGQASLGSDIEKVIAHDLSFL
jgi:hypothetical protein